MARVLDDTSLHAFIGGRPATEKELRARYVRQVVGHSADGAQGWLNWVVRLRESGAAVGTVQATLVNQDRRMTAAIAWVIATPHQGHGYARGAAAAMAEWLLRSGVDGLVAYVHPDHVASINVATHLGLAPTETVEDGEVRWVR
ncbi:MAG: GNAT family N-acetyltransferase [Propionibacteriales bacterium]|nr:GNAT family N-acetyltransferase [Propionibacteriales bacterium]